MKENHSENLSPFGNTGFFSQFEIFTKSSDNALKNFADNANIRPADWRILLPRAFYMDWSNHQTWQKSSMDPTIWLPIAFYPPEEKERAIQLLNIAGDIMENDKPGGKKEVKKEQAVQQFVNNYYGDYIGNDKAGGAIMKHSNAGGEMAGGNIDKENTINDPDKTIKENNK